MHHLIPCSGGEYEPVALAILIDRQDIRDLQKAMRFVSSIKPMATNCDLPGMDTVAWFRYFRVLNLDYLTSDHAREIALGQFDAEAIQDLADRAGENFGIIPVADDIIEQTAPHDAFWERTECMQLHASDNRVEWSFWLKHGDTRYTSFAGSDDELKECM